MFYESCLWSSFEHFTIDKHQNIKTSCYNCSSGGHAEVRADTDRLGFYEIHSLVCSDFIMLHNKVRAQRVGVGP